MRQALKHLFSEQITLPDNSSYYFTIQPYEFKSALGNVVTMLHEYQFTKVDQPQGSPIKLYRTKDGTWYDVDEVNKSEKLLHRLLKFAITEKEFGDTVPVKEESE